MGVDDLREAMLRGFADKQREELERGVTLVGPHRDDIALELGNIPVKGFASHGESWSYALALFSGLRVQCCHKLSLIHI